MGSKSIYFTLDLKYFEKCYQKRFVTFQMQQRQSGLNPCNGVIFDWYLRVKVNLSFFKKPLCISYLS